jgi:hypothetical protein
VAESGLVPQRGRYESRFVRAVDPRRPRAVWIRQTTHQRPGEPPTVAAWCTVWDEGPPQAVKQSGPEPTARLDATGADGTAAALGRRAAWQLAFTAAEPPLRHLPRRWMYRARLPRTKLESPQPGASVSGWVELDGRRLELTGWPGTTGHNWGTEHAARWAWLHGVAFDQEPAAWLDVALGRVRLGRAQTPWVANGAIRFEGGQRVAVGGLGRRAEVDAAPGRLQARLRGPGGLRLLVTAGAPLEHTVAFTYTDPGGGGHDVLNCSVAALSAHIERGDSRPRELVTAHGGVYELGLPAGAPHGVALQPYPDP